MAHRINVIFDDDAWEIVRSLPRGRRSEFISRALVETAASGPKRPATRESAALQRRPRRRRKAARTPRASNGMRTDGRRPPLASLDSEELPGA